MVLKDFEYVLEADLGWGWGLGAGGLGPQGLDVTVVLLDMGDSRLDLAFLNWWELSKLILKLTQQITQRANLLPGILIIIDNLTGLNLDQRMLDPLLGVNNRMLFGVIPQKNSTLIPQKLTSSAVYSFYYPPPGSSGTRSSSNEA